jgi:hypothetical protein
MVLGHRNAVLAAVSGAGKACHSHLFPTVNTAIVIDTKAGGGGGGQKTARKNMGTKRCKGV